jgi:predicted glycogen debranching enzyme
MRSEYQGEAQHHEWLLTNGTGGYALGYGSFINQRKYNGLLIASDRNFHRRHILAGIEELAGFRGNTFPLDANHYPNCIYPNGFEHIVKSWLRPYPAALYSSQPPAQDFIILKEVRMPAGVNAVVVSYTNLGQQPMTLTLRPKFSLRNHHYVNLPGTWDRQPPEVTVFDETDWSIRRPDNGCMAWCRCPTGKVTPDPVVYRQVYYPLEASRGYEATEDLYAPVMITIMLPPGTTHHLVCAAEELRNPPALIDAVLERYRDLPLPADHPRTRGRQKTSLIATATNDDDLFTFTAYRKLLGQAAADFLTADDIIAGYPWFGPWGRDSLISLGGVLCLPEHRPLIPRLLAKYGRHLKNGLLPNVFGEGGEGMNYDTVDASLWYCVRLYEYCRQMGEIDDKLLETAARIVLNYRFNRTLPFSFDPEDGLISLNAPHQALTWMDAKVYQHPVTPRLGKPVEINALWYNAVRAVHALAKKSASTAISYRRWRLKMKELAELAQQIETGFQAFVIDGFLADRIGTDGPVAEIRPNAVIAAALPFDVVPTEMLPKIWETARRELLTPYGLRTLSPRHPAYKRKYIGNQKQRDMAYHQGSTWAFLLAPMARLYEKAFRRTKPAAERRAELEKLIWRFRRGFMKGHIASVAELWDGDQPHVPKGCPAQAWSVMAVVEIEDLIRRVR